MNASAECGRELLEKLADTYVAAQSAGNATMLPLAADASYADNDEAMDIAEGGENHYIHESTVCTTPRCGRGR